MSGMPEMHSIVRAGDHDAGQEALVFAAASIVRQMGSDLGTRAVREVTSDGRLFRLEGRRLQTAVDRNGPVILVFVEPLEAPLPNDDELRRHFGLTRKESAVARLLAENLTNEQVAERLSISPHTARHHTERVLAKIGAKSRTAVRRAMTHAAGR